MSDNLKFVKFGKYCKGCEHYTLSEEDRPCDDCLEVPARLDTHRPDKFLRREGNLKDSYKYTSMRKLKDYLFDIYFDDLDYEYAREYFKTKSPSVGACSCVRNGNWYGRNMDWFYNNQVEFVVHTKGKTDGTRYSSIGIAGGMSEFTKSTVIPNQYNDIYKIVPFCLQDGINECGVVCNMNVVPHLGIRYTTPEVKRDSICSLMLVRYILDNFNNAKEAVNYIKKFVSVYNPDKLSDMDYDLHFMVGDMWNNYIIEFINGKVNVLERNYMTNFHLSGVIFNEDGKVITPESRRGENTPVKTNKIHPLGSGLERYNIIVDRYSRSNTKAGIITTMERLKYTRAYKTSENPSDPYWYSEFVGTRNLTCESTLSSFTPVVDLAGLQYTNRSRETAQTWHTCHTSIYDIEQRKLYLRNQEQISELEFTI